MSETSGYRMPPIPPWSTSVPFHARWVKWESTETPISSQFFFLNSSTFLSKPMISDGQTKVKSSG